tara:strand:- start:196 stop:492 length:297 start_codon:yes stop_codon:yes gene_type:complete
MFYLNLIIFILILVIINKIYIESFTNYRNIQFLPFNLKNYRNKKNIKPKYDLSPGFNDINYKFKNKKNNFLSNNYCKEKPQCYPCNGWKFYGHPICEY